MMRCAGRIAVLLALAALPPCTAGEIVFENDRFRAVLGPDAVWQSIHDKSADRACLARKPSPTFAAVRVDGKWHEANTAAVDADRLTVGFAGVDTRLTYRVETRPEWIAWHLDAVAGSRPTHIVLARLSTSVAEHVGPRLSGGWDGTTGICLVTTNLQAHGRARRHSEAAELAVETQDAPGPRLEGAGAAIVVAPIGNLDEALARLAQTNPVPTNTDLHGTPSKGLPLARSSYWFLRFGEADVDRVLTLCRQSGLRQVMMISHSWCKDVGHYTFRTDAYPDGVGSVRRTVARLHEADVLVGMHCFASKISKTDAYVTPVPDRRFWVDRTATLARAVDAKASTIRTKTDLREWPGSPIAKQKTWEGGVAKHREVILDDEIVQYESIGPEGEWHSFLGCTRSAWGTKGNAHDADTTCRHYGVDGCINGYIIDQETDLLRETTGRLAHIFNTCGFDMVYFDGGEDVDRRRFHHYVSKFQAVAMEQFTKRPLIHMGTIMTHPLWHSFTRSGTVDTYPNTIRGRLIAGGTWETVPTVRDHIDKSVAYLLKCREDRVPGELGWFGIWSRSKDFEGLQLDEIEYLMARSLAYDAPISLQTSFRALDAHPLTLGILEIVRAYETLRMAGKVPAEVCQRLREKGADFILLRRTPDAAPAFVRVEPLENVAGDKDLRACVGETGGGCVVTLWHATGKPGTLTVAVDPAKVSATDIFGEAMEVKAAAHTTAIPFGRRRTTVVFERMGSDVVRQRLAEATAKFRPPLCLWLQAEGAKRLVGQMAYGRDAGVQEPKAFGDVVVCTGRPSPRDPKPWYAEYTVDVPHEGRWTLWARVRYPTGADHSFGLVRPGDDVTLSGSQVLGNCGRNEKAWHWTGRGGGSTATPPGQPIVLRLEKGRYVFLVYAREGGGSAAVNPRLDILCLSDRPDYVPTDEDARKALRRPPP